MCCTKRIHWRCSIRALCSRREEYGSLSTRFHDSLFVCPNLRRERVKTFDSLDKEIGYWYFVAHPDITQGGCYRGTLWPSTILHIIKFKYLKLSWHFDNKLYNILIKQIEIITNRKRKVFKYKLQAYPTALLGT